ncbi:MBL fold metallo-hydrolase [Phycicoccus sp. Soil748]|uniref:MBL fold metallo-hydrolase n=1 Tax=Phycicoccus sp. Soil748 TaxID=1736397 RepID=UPI0007034D1B|nr:MBL fold metallo-hydrolase [Phycicoccus sp. Soil748]KRE54030.1 MBL fold metallo-hydrolase [Phycicoccus sp. Soil748]
MAKQATVELAPGVWRIPLLGDFVNGFILRDDDGQVTLVDMGVKKSGPKVMAALASIDSGPSDVTRLLLTHAHPDHAGGAAHVAAATGRDFAIHEDDASYAEAGQSPPRDQSFLMARLMTRLMGSGNDYAAVTVGERLTDGQLLDVAGGLEVVHTPGHSPGHVAYLHRSSGVLITGDSIFNVRGVRWPVRSFCTDFRLTQKTAHRLAELDYTTAAFTHGPHIADQPREAIRRFLARQKV